MLVPHTYIGGVSSTSSPSPASEDGGKSSVEGVGALGVAEDALLARRRGFVLDGLGVASGVVKRPLVGGGGVSNAAAEERRPRFRRPESPGEEYVFPIGLVSESPGEEGSVIVEEMYQKIKLANPYINKIKQTKENKQITAGEVGRR